MARCTTCRYKAETADGICPICELPQDTPKQDLSESERPIRLLARAIRSIAVLHLVAGVLMCIVAALLVVVLLIPDNPAAQNPTLLILGAVACLLLGLWFLFLAHGLSRYKKWAYYQAAVTYLISFVSNAVNLNNPFSQEKIFAAAGLILSALFFYLVVGNKRSKLLFRRSTNPAG